METPSPGYILLVLVVLVVLVMSSTNGDIRNPIDEWKSESPLFSTGPATATTVLAPCHVDTPLDDVKLLMDRIASN